MTAEPEPRNAALLREAEAWLAFFADLTTPTQAERRAAEIIKNLAARLAKEALRG